MPNVDVFVRHYPHTRSVIVREIRARFPDVELSDDVDGPNKPGYLLWMLDAMQAFPDREKVARWVGWVLAHAEIMGLFSNKVSRDLIRKDVKGQPFEVNEDWGDAVVFWCKRCSDQFLVDPLLKVNTVLTPGYGLHPLCPKCKATTATIL